MSTSRSTPSGSTRTTDVMDSTSRGRSRAEDQADPSYPRPMPGGPLDALTGVRVLDLSDDVAGSYCAKLFADAGAEVVKIEPPSGHRLRGWSLSERIGSDGDADGALFRYLAANQRSIVADLTDASGRAEVLELAAASDVVIESFPVGHLRALGIGVTELQRANPALNLVSITPFGQEGPRRDDARGDFLLQALSGSLDLHGDEHGAPARGRRPTRRLGGGRLRSRRRARSPVPLAADRPGRARRRVEPGDAWSSP